MARVTVEDCLEKIPNRFVLTLASSKRARQLAMTDAKPMVPVENDKATVLALREIADGLVDENILLTNIRPDEQRAQAAAAAETEISPEIIAETQTSVVESPASAESANVEEASDAGDNE